MLKLMKYELLKKSKLMIISASVLFLMEIAILFGIYKGGGWAVLSIFLIFFMIFGVIIFVFVDSIRSYSSDLNQKEGYSLFLTPTSGYKIIGSKAIMSFVELLLFTVIVFVFMVLNFQVTKALYPAPFQEVITPLFEALKQMYKIPNVFELFLMVLVYVFEWFSIIMIAILAMTLRKTILSNSKVGWLLSLIFFVVIYSTMETISMVALAPFGFYNELLNFFQTSSSATTDIPTFTFNIFKYVGVAACLYPIYLGTFFFFAGKLLNKRVDL